MAHTRREAHDDEEVVLDLRPHWSQLVARSLAFIVALVAGIAALALDWHDALQLLAVAAILGALGWAAVGYARWATSHLVLTTDRLIYRSGVLSRTGIEIPLERINTVFFRQSFGERLIGSGGLTIESAGEMGRQEFTNVRRPLNVQNEIYRQMEANENRKFDRVSRPSAWSHSIPEQIDQLDDLRRRGVLSEAEFQQKKAELLRRM